MEQRKVWLVRVPDRAEMDHRKLRDYLAESLTLGIVVVGQGVTITEMDVSALGGVVLRGGPMRVESILELPTASVEDAVTECGVPESGTGLESEAEAEPQLLREKNTKYFEPGNSEKMRIMERMKLYRTTKGLGCWKELAKATRSKRITEHVIRQIYLGEVTAPVEDWRLIDKGLTKLGVPIPNVEGAADG